MNRIVGMLMSILCFHVLADERKVAYWVVGSFSTLERASIEQSRVQEVSGQPVLVAQFDGGALYRLLVKKDSGGVEQKNAILSAGIEPWTLRIAEDELDVVSSSGTTDANSRYSVVLAAFRNESAAETEKERLENLGMGDLSILKTSVSGESWFRILSGSFNAPAASVMSDIRAAGFPDAWWLRHQTDTGKAPVVASMVSPEEPEVPLEPAEQPPAAAEKVVGLRAPRAGESYFDYCVGRANALERSMYCRNGSFRRLASAHGRISAEEAREAGGKILYEFCALYATAEEREEYCMNQAR